MSSERTTSREQEWLAIQNRVRQLLAEYGRDGRRDGDYHLIGEDFGTYEHKVIVISESALNPELLEAISLSLLDYSHDWRILFVEGDENGDEMMPPAGFKVSAFGPEPLQHSEISPEVDDRTKALYQSLSNLLGRCGHSDPFGKGDYWIVDDGWVPHSQKVCIFNIQFMTPNLAKEVQALLSQEFQECVVWFQIEVEEPGEDIATPGIRVFADRIEHDWDLDALRSIFKHRFAW